MKLSQLLGEVEVLTAAADLEREITGVSYDSRQTQEGDLFAAISASPPTATSLSPWRRSGGRSASSVSARRR